MNRRLSSSDCFVYNEEKMMRKISDNKQLIDPKIAYFTMEIGLEPFIPTYSGGLGVLSGDTVKSSADLELPMVAVTLIYHQGYFKQVIDDSGTQINQPEDWQASKYLEKLNKIVKVNIDGTDVYISAYRRMVVGITGYQVPVIFLDTDINENNEEFRKITRNLYGGDQWMRFAQEMVLGIGGVRMLREMNYKHLETFHMNEGHAAFLTLELLKETKRSLYEVWDADAVWDVHAVQEKAVFTTHTPVPAGHDRFSYEHVQKMMQGEIFKGEDALPLRLLKKWAGFNELNMSLLALNLSRFANGVAKKHSQVSREMFPGYDIRWVTNGVHTRTWTCNSFKELFDKYIEDWDEDPSLLRNAKAIPPEEIWDAHIRAKQELFKKINKLESVSLDINKLTIGFARRFATYKRATLIFQDIERLKRIGGGKLQLVFAGKAHYHDEGGKQLIRDIHNFIKILGDDIPTVFLDNYNMILGGLITSGVDIWLNNPRRPLEASGTSGMKSAHNGVPNFSVLDGWWIEGHREGITGWGIGPYPDEKDFQGYDENSDIEDLYKKLENIIIPLYYEKRSDWIDVMKNTISFNASVFNTQRMMKDYVTYAYFT